MIYCIRKHIKNRSHDMSNLYRFISFPSFVNLIEQQTERYVLPSTWEDTYEGYHLRLFETNDIEEVLYTLMNNLSPGNPDAAIDNYLKLSKARWLCYGQCWTTIPESDAFWRIYSYNRMTVRIETDESRINDLFSAPELSEKYNVIIDDIQYDLDPSNQLKCPNELIKDIYKTKRVTEPFFHKRRAFEHEHEKRIILLDKRQVMIYSQLPAWAVLNNFRKNNDLSQLSPDDAIKRITNEVNKLNSPIYTKDAQKSIEVPIPDIRVYIKSVMVHPQAENWIVDLVEKICQRTGLHFTGQSEMYKGLS